jgi:transcriptional regulator with XRE-family HTH domain
MKTLNEWMEDAGATDAAAAEAVGLSRGYFSRVRKGVVHPSLDTALRIYDWTGGRIDLRSMVPPRLANPRIMTQAPLKLARKGRIG